MSRLLYQEGLSEFCLGWQKSCQAFVNPDCRVHYVQIEESQRVVFVPSFINMFLRNAPGPSIRPGHSHDDEIKHIYQTWYTATFYDFSICT